MPFICFSCTFRVFICFSCIICYLFWVSNSVIQSLVTYDFYLVFIHTLWFRNWDCFAFWFSSYLLSPKFMLITKIYTYWSDEQYTAWSTDLEPMNTQPVGCLKWSQKVVLVSSSDGQFFWAARTCLGQNFGHSWSIFLQSFTGIRITWLPRTATILLMKFVYASLESTFLDGWIGWPD